MSWKRLMILVVPAALVVRGASLVAVQARSPNPTPSTGSTQTGTETPEPAEAAEPAEPAEPAEAPEAPGAPEVGYADANAQADHQPDGTE